MRGFPWPTQKIKSLKARRLIKLIIGYIGTRKEDGKMKGLPDIFMKTNEIQN